MTIQLRPEQLTSLTNSYTAALSAISANPLANFSAVYQELYGYVSKADPSGVEVTSISVDGTPTFGLVAKGSLDADSLYWYQQAPPINGNDAGSQGGVNPGKGT